MIELFKNEEYNQASFVSDIRDLADIVIMTIHEELFLEKSESKWEDRKDEVIEILSDEDFNDFLKEKISFRNTTFPSWRKLGYIYEGVCHEVFEFLKDIYFEDTNLKPDDIINIELAFDSLMGSTINMINMGIIKHLSLENPKNDIFEKSVELFINNLSYFEKIIRSYSTDEFKEFEKFIKDHRGRIKNKDLEVIDGMQFPSMSAYIIEDMLSIMIELINPAIYEIYEDAFKDIIQRRSREIFSTEHAREDCSTIDVVYAEIPFS